MSIDFRRLVKPIDINRLIFINFFAYIYWFRWLIFIDCPRHATVLRFEQLLDSLSTSCLAWAVQGKQGNIPRNIWTHRFCLFGLNSEASVEKQFFQIISTFGRRLSQRATRLAAVFIRTSYIISRGCLTFRNFRS